MKLKTLTKVFFYLTILGWFPFMWLVLIWGNSSPEVRASLFLAGFVICMVGSIGISSILSQVDLFKSAEEYNE